MLYLVLISVCFCILWLRVRSPKGPPVQPGGWPLIGHAFDILLKDTTQIWENLSKYTYYNLKHSDVTQSNLGPITAYILTDPDDCYTVSNVCLQKPYFYKFATLLTNGLAVIDPPMWKSDRKMFNRVLNQENLKTNMDVYNEECKNLCDKIGAEVGKGSFEPDSYIINHTLTTTFRTYFGSTSEECNRICETYADVVERSFEAYTKRFSKIWLHVPFIYNWSSLKKECDGYVKIATDITGSIVMKRKLELKEAKKSGVGGSQHNGEFNSLLDLLINVQEEEGISDVEIRERIDNLIIGNYDTTAASIIVTLAFIGSNPEVQEKVYNELKNVLGDNNQDINQIDLSKLVYLEAVIKESLRVYPIAPVLARKATEEVKLKNYTIPAGGFYLLSIYGMHRHAIWGADAEQFRPERWLEPGGVPDNANVYGAFSIGKRNCIGKNFGMLSVKITLAHLLLRFRITADISRIKWKWSTFLKPASGHDIAIELRT